MIVNIKHLHGEGAFAWNAPFDWRRRSMYQECIARTVLEKTSAKDKE